MSLVLALALWSAGEVSDGPLVLALEYHADRPVDWVRLEDVATPLEDPQGLWPLVKDVILPVGESPSVGWATVQRRLKGAGLPPERVLLRGPGVCQLRSEKSKEVSTVR